MSAELVFDTVIVVSAVAVLIGAATLSPVLLSVGAVVLFVAVCLVALLHDPEWGNDD